MFARLVAGKCVEPGPFWCKCTYTPQGLGGCWDVGNMQLAIGSQSQ